MREDEMRDNNDSDSNKTVKTNVNQTSKQAYYMLSSSSSSPSLVLLCYAMLWKSYHGVILFKLFELLLKFILGCSHAHLSLRCVCVCVLTCVWFGTHCIRNEFAAQTIYVAHEPLTVYDMQLGFVCISHSSISMDGDRAMQIDICKWKIFIQMALNVIWNPPKRWNFTSNVQKLVVSSLNGKSQARTKHKTYTLQ